MTDRESNGWSPFVGPRPFKREEEKLFFGRNYESEKIMSLIFGHSLVLIYAQSGAGKTSLFNAKIAPALEQKGLHVLPVARVGIGSQATHTKIDKENRNNITNSTPLERINPYILNAFQSLLPDTYNSTSFKSSSLADFLKDKFPKSIDQRGKPVPQLLILDQLEEVFSFYSDPTRWPKHQKDFFKQVNAALDSNPLHRIVFIIREDYLPQLDPFVRMLPEKLRPRFRLERLRRNSALVAITEPLKKAGRFFAPHVAKKLVDDLLIVKAENPVGKTVKVKGEYVEPLHLQVVCQRLWTGLPKSVKEITYDEIKGTDTTMIDFYDESIRETVKQTDVDENEIREWCEKKLITSSGTRNIVHYETKMTSGIPNNVIKILENRYLIRRESRSGSAWYELTHDGLIDPIRKSNSRRRLTAISVGNERLIKLLRDGRIKTFNKIYNGSSQKSFDFSGINLAYTNLSHANLSRANLSEIDLSRANLAYTNFSDTNLSNSILIGAYLLGSKLSKTKLIGSDLSRALLYNAYLKGANLQNADLRGANLYHAVLESSNLCGANLNRTYFGGATLRGVNLSNANLQQADISGADLSHALIINANLQQADISGADLSHVLIINPINYEKILCKNANFQGAIINDNILTQYLMENDAQNVPNVITNKNELQLKLEKRTGELNILDKLTRDYVKIK